MQTEHVRQRHGPTGSRGRRKFINVLFRWRPKLYEGRATLIVNADWNAIWPTLGWVEEICPNLEVFVVKGTHENRLQADNQDRTLLVASASLASEAFVNVCVGIHVFAEGWARCRGRRPHEVRFMQFANNSKYVVRYGRYISKHRAYGKWYNSL